MNDNLREYLQSEDWKRRAKIFKENKNYTCEICGNHMLLEVVELCKNPFRSSAKLYSISRFTESVAEINGNKDQLIQAHHMSYEHLGHESYKEIRCLCRPCHVLFHEHTNGKTYEQAWVETNRLVNGLSLLFDNQPDGKKEFAAVEIIEQWQVLLHNDMQVLKKKVKSELGIDIDGWGDNLYYFAKDRFDSENDFIGEEE